MGHSSSLTATFWNLIGYVLGIQEIHRVSSSLFFPTSFLPQTIWIVHCTCLSEYLNNWSSLTNEMQQTKTKFLEHVDYKKSPIFQSQCSWKCLLGKESKQLLTYRKKDHHSTALSWPAFQTNLNLFSLLIAYVVLVPATANNFINKVAYLSGCLTNICWINEWMIIIKYWTKAPCESCINQQNNMLICSGTYIEMGPNNRHQVAAVNPF